MPTKKEKMKKEQNNLVTANMGYVVTLARQYKSDILTTDDLVSEGAIGLMKAAEKYDPSFGKPFVTFSAPYIRRAIESAISRLQTETEVRSTDESLPVGSRNNYTLLNVLEDVNARPSDEQAELTTLGVELQQAARVLDERQYAVVSRYFGIGCERQTMAEIADALGMKRERVRQVRDQSLRKLKKIASDSVGQERQYR